MEDLSTDDINIIIIVAISTILALFRGLTREVLAITGWILAAYAALFIGPLVSPYLGAYIKVEWLASAICLILIFIIVLWSVLLAVYCTCLMYSLCMAHRMAYV